MSFAITSTAGLSTLFFVLIVFTVFAETIDTFAIERVPTYLGHRLNSGRPSTKMLVKKFIFSIFFR